MQHKGKCAYIRTAYFDVKWKYILSGKIQSNTNLLKSKLKVYLLN